MKNLDTIGRFMFAIPFGVFSLMHFTMAGEMAGMVPQWVPGGVLWVYLIGLALLAATVSFVIKVKVELAGQLLALLLLIFIFTIYLPDLLSGNMMAMGSILKETSLAGGALLMAHFFGEDR